MLIINMASIITTSGLQSHGSCVVTTEGVYLAWSLSVQLLLLPLCGAPLQSARARGYDEYCSCATVPPVFFVPCQLPARLLAFVLVLFEKFFFFQLEVVPWSRAFIVLWVYRLNLAGVVSDAAQSLYNLQCKYSCSSKCLYAVIR